MCSFCGQNDAIWQFAILGAYYAVMRRKSALCESRAHSIRKSYLQASSTATATETVIPTMGLLPAPRKPIISTSNPPCEGIVPAASAKNSI